MKDYIFRVFDEQKNKAYDFSLKDYMVANESYQEQIAPTDLLDTLKLVDIKVDKVDTDSYTETEKVMAEIIAEWIKFYGQRGLDTSKVVPDSMICFNIVKEISDKFTCILKAP